MTVFTDLPQTEASREEGLRRLEAFLPHAGGRYTEWRNHDFGPTGDNAVSALSPWLRHRLISEPEVIQQVMNEHGLEAAEKYIQEVCWRSYWKGYLERRPVHWSDYQQQCQRDREAASKDRQLAQRLRQATSGETGIECFDAWVGELITNGYLHNHARMWFASIWVFTLELPWALGADFFLRHLLDGDPASNTLSWRWVAGLHTQGKNYLARSNNIARFTNGRFNPHGQLNEDADSPAGFEKPPLEPSPEPATWQITGETGLLITEEDLTPEQCFGKPEWPLALAVQTTQWRSHEPISEPVRRFAHTGLMDALTRSSAAQQIGPAPIQTTADTHPLCATLKAAGVERLLTPWVPIGPTRDGLTLLRKALAEVGITLEMVPRRWDTAMWPAATHGFFRFWKAARPQLEDDSLI